MKSEKSDKKNDFYFDEEKENKNKYEEVDIDDFITK